MPESVNLYEKPTGRITARKLYIEYGNTEETWRDLNTNEKKPWELLVKEINSNSRLESQVNKLNIKLDKMKPIIYPEDNFSKENLKKVDSFRKTMAAYKITAFIRISDKIQRDVITSSRMVYNELNWGYNEKVYQEGVKRELEEKGYRVITEVPRTLTYKGFPLGDGVYVRTDMVIQTRNETNNKTMILELKADQGSQIGLKKAKQQLIRYLSSNVKAGHRGMVILFPDRNGETVKFLSCY
jgi:GxxExxY protein